MKHRLAVVLSDPHPCICRFFQHAAEYPDLDITVYFYLEGSRVLFRGVEWDIDLSSGYTARFLKNYSPWPSPDGFLGLFHPGIIPALSRRYDGVVLQGWHGLSSVLALLTAEFRGIPVLMRADQNVIERSRSWRRYARNVLLRVLFPRIDAFLTIGRRNAEFYRQFGVPNHKMFLTPHAVDNQFLRAERSRWEPARAALRTQYGIPTDAVVILFVGHLAPEKGLHDLLAAFQRPSENDAHLVLVGDGPLRSALEAYARCHGCRHVHFLGHQNYTRVPRCYALADIFVLPSHREAWGLVINEAMNFALPIVTTRVVGAAADLLEEGHNAFLYEPGDTERLATHLKTLVCNPDLRRQMGAESERRIATWSFQEAVAGLLSALGSVSDGRAASARGRH